MIRMTKRIHQDVVQTTNILMPARIPLTNQALLSFINVNAFLFWTFSHFSILTSQFYLHVTLLA